MAYLAPNAAIMVCDVQVGTRIVWGGVAYPVRAKHYKHSSVGVSLISLDFGGDIGWREYMSYSRLPVLLDA